MFELKRHYCMSKIEKKNRKSKYFTKRIRGPEIESGFDLSNNRFLY